MKVKKITDLKLVNSFFQLNLVKGFKYIDKAGEMVNNYYGDAKPPLFEMSLHGLNIKATSKYIDTIKHSSESLWIKFKVDTVDQVGQFLKEPVDIVKDIQDVSQFTRIGWRNHFIVEFENQKEIEKIQDKLQIVSKAKTTQFKFNLTEANMNLDVTVEFVVKEDQPDKKGLMFDVDLYLKKTSKIEKVNEVISKMTSFLKKDFINTINEVMEVKK